MMESLHKRDKHNVTSLPSLRLFNDHSLNGIYQWKDVQPQFSPNPGNNCIFLCFSLRKWVIVVYIGCLVSLTDTVQPVNRIGSFRNEYLLCDFLPFVNF